MWGALKSTWPGDGIAYSVVVVVGDDAVAATGEHVVLLVRCGNSILVVAVGCSMVDVEWLPQKK